jgi:hypothetical protein
VSSQLFCLAVFVGASVVIATIRVIGSPLPDTREVGFRQNVLSEERGLAMKWTRFPWNRSCGYCNDPGQGPVAWRREYNERCLRRSVTSPD